MELRRFQSPESLSLTKCVISVLFFAAGLDSEAVSQCVKYVVGLKYRNTKEVINLPTVICISVLLLYMYIQYIAICRDVDFH